MNPSEDPNTPPLLPAHRAFITPSPSQSHLSASSHNSSPFFHLLPPEIRRLILLEAFGERTVHLDLVFSHPPFFLSAEEQVRRRHVSHCGIDVGPRKFHKRDTARPKAWRWFSCVCHRDFEWCVRERARGSKETAVLMAEPHYDTCLVGTAAYCDSWRGETPGKCFVGVMGWLLACRQAYVEGIDVLYSTNSFHISNSDMMYTLPNLLRAQHRAMIKSVELIWRLSPESRESGLSELDALLQKVPEAFPHLKSLYLYPAGIWNLPVSPPDDRMVEFGTDILELIDGMVEKFGSQLQVCDVTIPFRKFHSNWVSGIGKGYKYEHSGPTRLSSRIWRPLAPVQQDNESGGPVESGYWIREGPDDVPYPFAHMAPS
ncbi:hypothetical protein F4805DRAFT_461629 [Annulohypoxylon moriforme]|nr:hypothetical protein F4805DRAFT_461629 [Annulohypoxylon moriforme]